MSVVQSNAIMHFIVALCNQTQILQIQYALVTLANCTYNFSVLVLVLLLFWSGGSCMYMLWVCCINHLTCILYCHCFYVNINLPNATQDGN